MNIHAIEPEPMPTPFTSAPVFDPTQDLRYGREYDWIGHHVATALAMIYLFLLPLATAPKDWAFAILTGWTLIRLPHTWRSYKAFAGMPLLWVTLAWVGWQLLSITWTNDVDQAWDELKVQRMLITPLLLWPILDRAPWLVMAALAGVLAQNGVQVLQEVDWVATPATAEGRLRGLIHPIHSAMWFGAGALWHLAVVVNCRGWKRWVALALAAIAIIGLIATGSRGPWIATGAALIAGAIIVPLRRPTTRWPVVILAACAVIAIIIAGTIAPAMSRNRLTDAQQEIAAARERQVYWTSTGLRLGLWGWAIEVWRSAPLQGVGAGGFSVAYKQLESFKSAVETARQSSMIEEVAGYQQALASGRDVTALRGYRRGVRLAEQRYDYLTRDHAHSTYLHTLASQGLIGLTLLLVTLALIARQCWRDRPDHPYSDAMLLVLICWLVGAQFDCYELNGHQLGLLMLLAALTLPGRAKVRWRLSAIGD